MARWSEAVDEILAGDQVVMLASVTPAGGVVLGPVTNFAIRDRDASTVTVNSSIGAGRKLQRMARNPKVALAYHTRAHSFTDRSEYVLVQGTASLSHPVENQPDTISESWERFAGPLDPPLWRRWLRIYYRRVNIEVAAHRVIVWTELTAASQPQVHGVPPPEEPPPSQRPPTGGTGPRVDTAQVSKVAARLPHVLLGWVDTDGFPFVVPVQTGEIEDRENGDAEDLVLRTSQHHLPPGERRAGMTSHAFTRHVLGQHQQVLTGWLRADPAGDRASYAPHTRFGYRLPPSRLLYRLAVGYATRRGLRASRLATRGGRRAA